LRWFESMYTLQGKIWPTCHTLFTLGPYMVLGHTYLMWSVYNNLLWVVNSVGRILLLLRKSAPDSTSQLGWVACGTRLSFSPNTAIEAVGLSQATVDGRLRERLLYMDHVRYIWSRTICGLSVESMCRVSRGFHYRVYIDSNRCDSRIWVVACSWQSSRS
jgi:hypothetical protein